MQMSAMQRCSVMPRYLIIVQPGNGSRDYWLYAASAADSDGFARWVHKSTGAAVSIHDNRTDTNRLTLGDFDTERT
jgi:hypothetical protein